MNDGSYGEPVPFDKGKMQEMLEDENVEHVEVFQAKDNELKRRKRLFADSQEATASGKLNSNANHGKNCKTNPL